MFSKAASILLFLSAVLAYSQVTLAVATEDSDLKVNERFTVTFILEISGDEYIQESPLKLPDFSKFNVLGTASNRNTYVDPKKNIVINQLVYQVALEPKDAGKVRIGSALVQVNGKMYKTEPTDLIVANNTDKKNNPSENLASKDIYLNVEVKQKSIYLNQPTIAVLKAYSKDFDNFRKVGDIQLPSQKNANFRLVSNQKSDIEKSSGNMVSQVIGVFMIFPTKSGKIEIEPTHAKIKHKNLKISSNKINLNVKKLPAGTPENYKNAVGNFALEIQKSAAEKAEINKPITVDLRLTGEGNLANIQLPKIVVNDNFQLFAPKITTNFAPASKGLKGEIVMQYILIPKVNGNLSISSEDFTYFNPETKKYITIDPQKIDLDILSPEQISDSKSALEKVNDYTNNLLEKVNTPIINTKPLQVKNKEKINWETIALNSSLFAVFAFLLFFIRKNYNKRKKNKSVKITALPIETIAEKEQQLKNQNPFSLQDELKFLKNLAEKNETKSFYTAYEHLLNDTDNQIFKKHNVSIFTFLEQQFGVQSAEELRAVNSKMAIEKYAPVSTNVQLVELYQSVENVFSKIIDFS